MIKCLNNPPAVVRLCFFAVLNLYVGIEEGRNYGIPERRGRIIVKQEDSWKFSKWMMRDPFKFMENLNDYKRIIDENRVPEKNFENI